MEKLKIILIYLRNAMAFSFSWLVLCVVLISLVSGVKAISVIFLLKLLALCFWGVLSFGIAFVYKRSVRKGFMFSLSIFYVLFIPVEIAMLYLTGIFTTKGSVIQWLVFGGIAVGCYLVSFLVDRIVMRKKSDIYTEKLRKYISER